MSGIFCQVLLHLEVIFEFVNMAWFGVADLTKFSIVASGELAHLLVVNRK